MRSCYWLSVAAQNSYVDTDQHASICVGPCTRQTDDTNTIKGQQQSVTGHRINYQFQKQKKKGWILDEAKLQRIASQFTARETQGEVKIRNGDS